MTDTIKYFLEESKMPKTWYNICADLPKPMEPPLHPGTLKPIGPDDLERLECEAAVASVKEAYEVADVPRCLDALGDADGRMERLRRRV